MFVDCLVEEFSGEPPADEVFEDILDWGESGFTIQAGNAPVAE